MKVIIAAVSLMLGLAVSPASGSLISARVADDGCQALQQKAKKAAKAGKRAKAKRLKLRYKTCRSTASIRADLADYTFTGKRGDGQPVTITLCSSGAWSVALGSRPVATSSGTTWLVRYPKVTSRTSWVTQVADKPDRQQGGWSVGFAREGESFQFGIASFDEVSSLGSVTRSPAGAACST